MQAPTLVSECLGFMPEVENLNANPTKGDQHQATWNTVSHTSYALLIFCVYIRSMKSHLNTKHFLFNLLCFPFDFVVSAVLPSYSFLFIFFSRCFLIFPVFLSVYLFAFHSFTFSYCLFSPLRYCTFSHYSLGNFCVGMATWRKTRFTPTVSFLYGYLGRNLIHI